MFNVKDVEKGILKLAFSSDTFDEFTSSLQENNYSLSKDEAKEIFEYVENDKKRELNDDEIKKIAGGVCDYESDNSQGASSSGC